MHKMFALGTEANLILGNGSTSAGEFPRRSNRKAKRGIFARPRLKISAL
jgi:hypothetical protein